MIQDYETPSTEMMTVVLKFTQYNFEKKKKKDLIIMSTFSFSSS